jgi:hypothetical protein
MKGSQAAKDFFLDKVKPYASGQSADFDKLQALLPEESLAGWTDVYGSNIAKAHALACHNSLAAVSLSKESMVPKGTLADVLTALLQNKATPSAPSLASANSDSPEKAVTFMFDDNTEDFVRCSGKLTLIEAFEKAAAENDGLMALSQVGSFEIQNTARNKTIAITIKNAASKRVRDYDLPAIFADGLTFKVIKLNSPNAVANAHGGEG